MAPHRPRRSPRMRWALVAAFAWALVAVPLAIAAPADERERIEAALQGLAGQARIAPLVEFVVASRQEAPERALSAGDEALALLARWPDPAAEVRVLNEMGWAYMVLGRYDEASAMAGRGRDLAEREGDSPGLARALNNLGVIARSRGEPGQAIVFFEKALAIERVLGRPREIAGVLNNLGVAHGFDLADYDTALSYTREALRLRESLGEPQDIALSENNLGCSMPASGIATARSTTTAGPWRCGARSACRPASPGPCTTSATSRLRPGTRPQPAATTKRRSRCDGRPAIALAS